MRNSPCRRPGGTFTWAARPSPSSGATRSGPSGPTSTRWRSWSRSWGRTTEPVGSYRVTVEQAPDVSDLALLEAKMAAAAAAAAGVREEEEFGVFVRGEDGAVVA